MSARRRRKLTTYRSRSRFAELKETLAEQFVEAEELSAIVQKKLQEVSTL